VRLSLSRLGRKEEGRPKKARVLTRTRSALYLPAFSLVRWAIRQEMLNILDLAFSIIIQYQNGNNMMMAVEENVTQWIEIYSSESYTTSYMY